MNNKFVQYTDAASEHIKLWFGSTAVLSVAFDYQNVNFFSYWRYNPLWVCILQPSSGAIASSFTRFLDRTQRRATVDRTPLNE